MFKTMMQPQKYFNYFLFTWELFVLWPVAAISRLPSGVNSGRAVLRFGEIQ